MKDVCFSCLWSLRECQAQQLYLTVQEDHLTSTVSSRLRGFSCGSSPRSSWCRRYVRHDVAHVTWKKNNQDRVGYVLREQQNKSQPSWGMHPNLPWVIKICTQNLKSRQPFILWGNPPHTLGDKHDIWLTSTCTCSGFEGRPDLMYSYYSIMSME